MGHHHHEPPAAGRQPEIRSLVWALVVALAVMSIELVGGALSGSLGQRADAGHMLADASALLLSLGAVWVGTRPADVRRTFGYYRLEILAAALNGVALLGIAAFILYEAWHRFRGHAVLDARTMLATGGAGLAANLGGFAVLWRARSHSLNVRSALWHLAGDVVSSVGVVVAAAAMAVTHFYWLDPLLSAAIALLIVYGALRLLAEAVDILLEAVPGHLDLADILHHMERAEGVQAVHDLHLWTISSGMYALSAHLVVRGHDACQNDAILTAVKTDLQREFGIAHTTLQIESDAYRHVEEVH
ncbi:MAG TPA: cation diffusion facilitator family transporter [Myxococcales bacterium]|nr:cation diffusion facilitator family transporter [Myxococcales bacterium]